MAPRRTQNTDPKPNAEKAADDNKAQETAAEQQAKAEEKPAPKTQPKDAPKAEDDKTVAEKVDITEGSENRDPIPVPEQHQDRAMNEADSYVSKASLAGVEELDKAARARMLQVAQVDTSSQSGYVDVFRAMANPPENAVKASKAVLPNGDESKKD